ncbi:MAG: hypothetical protein JO262_20550 [Solirubrobacterales bacterium]|nr:hypothetical protein [Solirubrobacterales bacterium]MBV9944528.1 hypothetical protein [Solirubrobacterales bacterium]
MSRSSACQTGVHALSSALAVAAGAGVAMASGSRSAPGRGRKPRLRTLGGVFEVNPLGRDVREEVAAFARGEHLLLVAA